MIEKPKRIKDTKLLDRIRNNGYSRCQVCGQRPSQTHHIKSKGSGGGDVSENIVRLCFICHGHAHRSKPVSDAEFYELALKRIEEEGE